MKIFSKHYEGLGATSQSKLFSKAFTLPEVILTIGIVGIIAALTIPMLNQQTNDKELVTGFLKAHSILFNALKQAEVLEETKVNKLASDVEFMAFFEKYLKTVKKCDWDVCLLDGQRYDYYGEFYPGCTHVVEGYTNALRESCIKLVVDVNGNRGPNRTGKDIFGFWVTRTGVYPEGGTETCTNMDCGAYVLAHHKLYSGADPQKYFHPIAHCKSLDESGCTACKQGYFLSAEKDACVEVPDFCTSADGTTCVLADGSAVVYALGDTYVTKAFVAKDNSCNLQSEDDGVSKGCAEYNANGTANTSSGTVNNYQAGAVKFCEDNGMKLPTKDQMMKLYSACKNSAASVAVCPDSGTYFTNNNWTNAGYSMTYTINFDTGLSNEVDVWGRNGRPGVFCVDKDYESALDANTGK